MFYITKYIYKLENPFKYKFDLIIIIAPNIILISCHIMHLVYINFHSLPSSKYDSYDIWPLYKIQNNEWNVWLSGGFPPVDTPAIRRNWPRPPQKVIRWPHLPHCNHPSSLLPPSLQSHIYIAWPWQWHWSQGFIKKRLKELEFKIICKLFTKSNWTSTRTWKK